MTSPKRCSKCRQPVSLDDLVRDARRPNGHGASVATSSAAPGIESESAHKSSNAIDTGRNASASSGRAKPGPVINATASGTRSEAAPVSAAITGTTRQRPRTRASQTSPKARCHRPRRDHSAADRFRLRPAATSMRLLSQTLYHQTEADRRSHRRPEPGRGTRPGQFHHGLQYLQRRKGAWIAAEASTAPPQPRLFVTRTARETPKRQTVPPHT